MTLIETENRRNFAIVGHSGDGKTALAEALLHVGGAINTPGLVQDGTSVLDNTPEERERKTTLTSSIYSFNWQDHSLTLVDTPGDPNFQADGKIALQALDGALLAVSAVDGPKVGTESMWGACDRKNAPVLIVVCGMDRERADFFRTVESLRDIGVKATPLTVPIGAGPDFKGFVDLITGNAQIDGKVCEVPNNIKDQIENARQTLIESIAETDDALLEKYLDEGNLSTDEISTGLIASVRGAHLVPVFATSSVSEVGVENLLTRIIELFPTPRDLPPYSARSIVGNDELQLEAKTDAPMCSLVFKTIIDRYAGTLSVLRVISGTIRSDTGVLNATRDHKVRLGKLLRLRGGEHEDIGEAIPGDIIAVAKLKDVHTGDILTDEKGGVRINEISIPHGVLSYAVEAESKGDEDKLFSSLARLVEEDPTLSVERDPATGEFLLTGMGELHIRLSIERLQRIYNVAVELKTPKVPYRETITRKAEHIEGKLKKQTGGKGMFGVCYLSVEPLARGEGIEFVNEIVGGSIPRNLIPAVEKGVLDAKERGPLAGYPVVDIRVRCIDGKHHSVDSNEMAFKLAGSMGFKSAVEAARPEILEPIMNIEVAIPEDYVGDVMGDISSKRGRVQTSEQRGSNQIVKASVPMSEMLEYASTLTSMTGGKGSFQMEFSHYDQLPAQIRDKVVAEAKAQQDSET